MPISTRNSRGGNERPVRESAKGKNMSRVSRGRSRSIMKARHQQRAASSAESHEEEEEGGGAGTMKGSIGVYCTMVHSLMK